MDESDPVRLLAERIELAQLWCYLIEASTLPSGEIEAQQIGAGQPSLASAGALLMAGHAAGGRDDLLANLVTLCERSVKADGRLQSTSGHRPTDWTSWAAGQLLTGLSRCAAHLTDNDVLQRLHDAMIQDFFDSRSSWWSFRGNRGDSRYPIFLLYPSLALACTTQHFDSPRRQEVMQLTARRVEEELKISQSVEDVVVLLCVARALAPHLDEPARIPEDSVERAEAILLDRIQRNEYPENFVIRQAGQPLWYVAVDRQFSYLLTRTIWPLNHPVNAWGIAALGAGFDEVHDGWRSDMARPEEPIYSWTSALGILATSLLRSDLEKTQTTTDQIVERVQEMQITRHVYDVVVSFSGRQRSVAEAIASKIKDAGFTVFYDLDRQHDLLGEDLSIYLQKVYFSQSKFAVAVLSPDFVESDWAGGWEWKAILSRMQQQRSAYLLPYFHEHVEVPGLNSTIGYVSAETHDPEAFAELVIKKLQS